MSAERKLYAYVPPKCHCILALHFNASKPLFGDLSCPLEWNLGRIPPCRFRLNTKNFYGWLCNNIPKALPHYLLGLFFPLYA